jgi:DtxR family Mn-dependent transcriptional regulator
MSELLSQSIQDYLKHIYALSADDTPASTTDLAAGLGIAPASVTGMIQRLSIAKPKLVHYHKHQGVTLTDAGKRAALEVIRRHRLLETWLVQTLGYSWDEVHEEAERLEHVISEEMEARIAAALGNPSRDPHGDLIPAADLTLPSDDTRPLISLRAGESATVKRVVGDDPGLLRHLHEIGIMPETIFTVKDFSKYDGNLTIHVEGQSSNIILGTAITNQIFVEPN